MNNMSRSEIRSKTLQHLIERDWIREHIPDESGFVVEDLDMIVKIYDPKKSRDSGKFRLVEKKNPHEKFNYAQILLFKTMDHILTKGDPDKKCYQGFYLIIWGNNEVRVNEKILSRIGGQSSEFGSWLLGRLYVEPFTQKYFLRRLDHR
jgi:hypothetical protein